MQETLAIIFWILSGVIILFSLIPLIRKNHWTFRIFEFPRIQKWTINTAIAVAFIFSIGLTSLSDWILISLLAINFCYLSYQIFPYLPFAQKQIKKAKKEEKVDISVLICNVYQENRAFEKLSNLVHDQDADLVVLIETDKWWKEKCLNSFGTKYGYQILEDRENTYGMLIFSKLELRNTKVRHLIKEEVPSIETEIILRKSKSIKFYSIHPEPPVPSENRYSTDRDAEILMIGKEVANEKMPIIVAGDLNDVAWSYTSILFQKISGLLDPRRGRGLFSTFHAKYPLFRWPLDHVFCSGHFRVNKMKRLKNIGSDHFPILILLHLHTINDNSKELDVNQTDTKIANEKISDAQ